MGTFFGGGEAVPPCQVVGIKRIQFPLIDTSRVATSTLSAVELSFRMNREDHVACISSLLQGVETGGQCRNVQAFVLNVRLKKPVPVPNSNRACPSFHRVVSLDLAPILHRLDLAPTRTSAGSPEANVQRHLTVEGQNLLLFARCTRPLTRKTSQHRQKTEQPETART